MKNYNKRRDKLKKILFVALALIMIFQIGCKGNQKEDMTQIEEPEDISTEVAAEDKIIIERSEDLSDYVVELFGVDDAATIIFNDTALVCVIMAYDAEFTQETKELISELILDKDAAIKEVLVSNDEKTFFQVVEVISSLMNGSPYDKHVGEISKLIEKSAR